MSEFNPTDHFAQDRLEKLDQLADDGVNPYPADFEPDLSLAEFNDQFESIADEELPDETYQLAGRIRRFNDLGRLAFLGIEDASGGLQLFIDEETEGFDQLDNLDRGDIVGGIGEPMRSDSGELSLHLSELRVLTKALNHPPSSGLDEESRIRNRPVAMWRDPLHSRLETRFEVVSEIRSYLESKDFTEADTTVLQNVYGGAAAEPFTTYCNAKDREMYLRIATEIDLKKLVVGGFERVFEIGKVFRNEDIDTTHNPEFLMLEVYEAWADYEEMMDLTENLVCHILDEVADGQRQLTYDGKTIDFSTPWERLTMAEAIIEHGGPDVAELSDEEIRSEAEALGAEFEGGFERGLGVMEIFEAVAEPELMDPTFVIDHPQETTPLCKDHRSKEGHIERFELMVAGAELANSYTELNDPVQQGEHFAHQLERLEAGDDEAHRMDESFLQALGYGMPPTGGLGIGIDRLIMLLTDATSIKEVLPFPMVNG